MATPEARSAPQSTPQAGRASTTGGAPTAASAGPDLRTVGYAQGKQALSPTGAPGQGSTAAAVAPEAGVDPRVAAAEGPVAAGNFRQRGDPLDITGDLWRFRFADPALQEGLVYLITEWAGDADLEAALATPYGQEPPWVQPLRYRALQAAEKPGVADRTAALAARLCDQFQKVAPIRDPNDPRLSQTHRDVLAQASKRMDTSHGAALSKEEKAKGRVDLFENRGNADGRVSKNGGTSCGLLPGTVMGAAGVAKSLKAGKGQALLTGPSVGGMRDEAMKIGAWHVAAKGDIPPPGAPYMLTSDAACKAVEHVGIIHQTDVPDPQHGLVWRTMDAGQGGDGYAAMAVTRKVERRGDGVWLINTLPGQLGDPSKWRKLAGWVDLDRVAAVQAEQRAAAAPKPR